MYIWKKSSLFFFSGVFSDEAKGSDVVLEAILEAEVARNAQQFFSQPQNQIPKE